MRAGEKYYWLPCSRSLVAVASVSLRDCEHRSNGYLLKSYGVISKATRFGNSLLQRFANARFSR
jgi:hypothetical protein